MLLDLVSTHWMMSILGVILLISAIKTFQHAQRQKEHSCS